VNGVGEKRPAPKEEVKAKAVIDDGYVLFLVLFCVPFSISILWLLFGTRERNGRDRRDKK